MARKYSRDNRGRFATGGGGATARGGRLATASGGKRKTQTMKAEGGQPAGTIAKRQKVVPMTAKDRAGVAEVKRRKSGKLSAEDRMMDKAMKAAYPGVPTPGGRTIAARAKAAPKGNDFRGSMTALKERRRVDRATRQMNTPKRKGTPGAGTSAPRGAEFRGNMTALKERRRIGRATRQMNTPRRRG